MSVSTSSSAATAGGSLAPSGSVDASAGSASAMGTDRSAAPMVRAEGVHKRFGRLEVLKGISLEVARGEVMCMLGPSGSGKSTFLRCVNHLEKINAGRL